MTTAPGLNSPQLVRDLEIALGLRPSQAEDLATRLKRAIALEGVARATAPNKA